MAARVRRRLDKRGANSLQSLAMIVCAIAIVTVVGVLGIWKLWQRVTGMKEFLVDPANIAFNTDSWIRSEAAIRDFRRTAPKTYDEHNTLACVLDGPVSIFAPDLTSRVAEAYRASPWVRKVKAVRRSFPNQLEVDLEIREPYARIFCNGSEYCVDEAGVCLDTRIYRFPKNRQPELGPEIRLTSATKSPRAGQQWDEPAVRGGLAMLKHCKEQFGRQVKIQSIRVETFKDDRGRGNTKACLKLANGTKVEWGCTPDSRSAVENTTAKKTQTLLAIVHKEGENLSRLGDIDLRWDPTLWIP